MAAGPPPPGRAARVLLVDVGHATPPDQSRRDPGADGRRGAEGHGRPGRAMERAAAERHDVPGRREQLIEVGVFVFLIAPSLVFSFSVVGRGEVGFGLVAAATILRDASLVSLILFFLWHNRESVRAIGWTTDGVWRELGIGLLLFPAVSYGAALLDGFVRGVGLAGPSAPPAFLAPQTGVDLVLAVVLVIVVAIAEETIFRGYLMLRLKAAVPRPVFTVGVSSVIFALGHGYGGPAGVVTVGAVGAALGTIYLWRGSLVAVMTIHFLQDFVGLVLRALLAGGR